MMRSLLRIYDWSGRLPMWANVVETNIMIGTHVDAVQASTFPMHGKQSKRTLSCLLSTIQNFYTTIAKPTLQTKFAQASHST